MIDEFMDNLHALESGIADVFPLDADMCEYLSKLKDENVVGVSEEYISMAFDIAAMYFHDAIKFVPVVLLVEVSRKINKGFGGCAECVVFWIRDLPRQDLMRLTRPQLAVLRQWLALVASDDFADNDLGNVIGIVDDALGNVVEHED